MKTTNTGCFNVHLYCTSTQIKHRSDNSIKLKSQSGMVEIARNALVVRGRSVSAAPLKGVRAIGGDSGGI